MATAPLAVLAQRDAVRVVALGLVGLVVPALALLTREGDGDPDVSAGHLTACSETRVLAPGKGKPRHGARSATQDSASARPTGGSHAATTEHVRDGPQEDLEIRPERPVRDVQVVDAHHLLQRDPRRA